MSTEFPSMKNEDGGRRGGILLFRLKRDDSVDVSTIKLKVKNDDVIRRILTYGRSVTTMRGVYSTARSSS